jgi:hypothetical protein
MEPHEILNNRYQEQEEGRSGGKIEWKLSDVNTRAVSRKQNELVGKSKMVAGDVINIRG